MNYFLLALWPFINPLSGLQQLEGMWQRLNTKSIEFEEWKMNNAYEMEGRMYKLKGSDTLFSEHILLVYEQNEVYYKAKSYNQSEQGRISFKLSGIQNNTYTFENPEHDFPRRIMYAFTASDSLHAWIDDGSTDPQKRVDFYFRKVKN